MSIDCELLAAYRSKVESMSDEDVRKVLVGALYHLQVVCDSRNSFDRTALEQAGAKFVITRTPTVEAAQHEAVSFLKQYRV